METEKKKLFTDTALMTFGQLANLLLPFLALPYLTRVLGIEAFGLLVVCFSLVNVAAVVTDFGFNLSAPAKLAHLPLEGLETQNYIGAIYVGKFLLAFLVCTVVSTAFLVFPSILNGQAAILALVCMTIIGQGLSNIWLLQSLQKFRSLLLVNVLARLVYFLGAIFLVKSSQDLLLALGFYFLGQLLATVVGFILAVTSHAHPKLSDWRTIWLTLKESGPFFLSRASVSIYTSASGLVVGSFAGFQAAGFYGAAEKIYQVIQSMQSPVIQVLYPYMNKKKDIKFLHQYVLVFICAIGIATFAGMMFSRELISVVFGDKFSEGSSILVVFLILANITFLSSSYGYPAFASFNRLDIPNKSVVFGSALHLVSLSTLIVLSMVSPIWVVLAVLVTETVVLLIRIYFLKKLRHPFRVDSQ